MKRGKTSTHDPSERPDTHRLSNRRDGSDGRGLDAGWVLQSQLVVQVAAHVLLRAVARDVPGLATLVARLPGCVERPAVGSSAVARDVTQLAAGVALHGLGLAVAGKVVRATALVTSRRA